MLPSSGDVVVKLPKVRVDELIASGAGERFAPGPDRVMKEWLVFAGRTTHWVDLAREACAFVNRVSTKRRQARPAKSR